MRPATVAEACRRIREGQSFDRAMGDFLQAFYAEPSQARRGSMLAEEPAPFDDPRYDALLGGPALCFFQPGAPRPSAALDRGSCALPCASLVPACRRRSGSA